MTDIPAQKEGGFSDNVSKLEFETVAEAILHFETVKKKFLDINSWELYAGKALGEFALCDRDGNLVLDAPHVHQFIRIKVPALPNLTEDKYDWVEIDKLENEKTETSETVYIRARPTESPQDNNPKTSHFFKDKATCNFLINRTLNIITVEIHGRNEKPNTENLTVIEGLRNVLVASGANIMGSKIQWKSLVEGLIRKDEK